MFLVRTGLYTKGILQAAAMTHYENPVELARVV